MSKFYTDSEIGTVTYQTLINDINNNKYYTKYCFHGSFYQIFKDIIVSILAQKEIILLDKYLFDECKFNNEIIFCDFPNINDIKELPQLLIKAENWTVTLFTSGTTGVPKKVTHSFNNITRNIIIKEKFSKDVWGYTYNPTHMAGLQVFLQAIMNLNHIVKLYNYSNEIQLSLIEENKVNKLSGTPTFYKMLFNDNIYFYFVKNVTLGGEKTEPNTIGMIKKMFPYAKINNIYASTEIGTLLRSDTDIFTVKDELKNKIKIIDNQLFVSGDYLGKINSQTNNNEFYPTGDIVEILNMNPLTFKFLGRINEVVNIGGNKVYPQEIENIIQSFEGIKFCKVYSKTNSVTGNILVCDIVLVNNYCINEYEIRKKLSEKVPSYMIPRLFNFVTELEITRSGKIKR